MSAVKKILSIDNYAWNLLTMRLLIILLLYIGVVTDIFELKYFVRIMM